METRLDIERAITFVFKDPKWVEKIVGAAVLTLTIIGIPAVIGWALEIQRREIEGTATDSLPEWNQTDAYFKDGVKLLLVYLVWLLPFIIIFTVIWLLMMGITVLSAETDYSGVLVFFFPFFILGFQFLTLAFNIIQPFFLPLISGAYLETSRMKAAFNFRRIYAIARANFWILFAAAYLGSIASMLLKGAGMMLFFVGFLIAAPIGKAIQYNLYGQAYRISRIRLGEIPAGELEGVEEEAAP